jgi:hypothetical protein
VKKYSKNTGNLNIFGIKKNAPNTMVNANIIVNSDFPLLNHFLKRISIFSSLLKFGGASPKILIFEARPRSLTLRMDRTPYLYAKSLFPFHYFRSLLFPFFIISVPLRHSSSS